jgi:hypothetical protein
MRYREIEHAGATALLTAHAEPYFFQLAGALTALEAIWAYLSSKDVRRSGYTGVGIRLEAEAAYRKFLTPLPGTALHELVLVHPAGLKDWPGEDFLLLSRGEGIPAGFFRRLRRALKLPVLPEWREVLWERGQEEADYKVEDRFGREHARRDAPVERLAAQGVQAWKVKTGALEPVWLEIIREMLQEERARVAA